MCKKRKRKLVQQVALEILVLAQHLTVVAKPLFFALVHGHARCLGSDVAHLVAIIIGVHGALPIVGTEFALPVGIEEHAQSAHAHATKYAEDVALVLVELGRGFATKDEEVVAEEGLYAC